MFDDFVRAQDLVYDRVLEQLRNGCKEGHWMWFIFPQLAGLGSSRAAARFALRDAEQTRQYWPRTPSAFFS